MNKRFYTNKPVSGLLLSASKLNELKNKFVKLPFQNVLLVFSGLVMAVLFNSIFSATRIYETASDIPSNYVKEQKVITGIVVKVTDGDTYRIRHTPNWFSTPVYSGPLSEHTIAVRIAAVDTPETAKFGASGQPLGDEVKNFAKSKLLDKKVKVKVLSRDQYQRVVGTVSYSTGFFSRKDISEELLSKGYAFVYRQGGAQYGDGGINKWNSIEEQAKKKKLGVWSDPNFETPSEYKKRTKKNKESSS